MTCVHFMTSRNIITVIFKTTGSTTGIQTAQVKCTPGIKKEYGKKVDYVSRKHNLDYSTEALDANSKPSRHSSKWKRKESITCSTF